MLKVIRECSQLVLANNEEYVLWILATVHAPQLPKDSSIRIFGQVDMNPVVTV